MLTAKRRRRRYSLEKERKSLFNQLFLMLYFTAVYTCNDRQKKYSVIIRSFDNNPT